MALRVRTTALIAASALVLAACGGGSSDEGVADLSASKILAKAEKQLAQEEFITIKGKGADEESGDDIEVNLAFAGETVSGTIGTAGQTFELLKADGKSYFKADQEFFESSGAPAELMEAIGDKWIVINPDDESFGDIANFTSKKEFIDELLEPEGKVSKGKEKKVNGVECVALKADGTFYFDKSDAKPIQLVKTGDEGGAIDFSYDKIDEAEAPSADEVVDLAQLGA